MYGKQKTLPGQRFLLNDICWDSQGKLATRLTAGQYASRFIVALVPVGLIHAGNHNAAAG